MKTIFTVSALLLAISNYANAAYDKNILLCESQNGKTIVAVEQMVESGSENDMGETATTASMLVVKVSGKSYGYRVKLAGSKSLSAKGEYYDLKGGDGTSLFISAPASHSQSELVISGGRRLLVDCF
jgi:hypothetical protein